MKEQALPSELAYKASRKKPGSIGHFQMRRRLLREESLAVKQNLSKGDKGASKNGG